MQKIGIVGFGNLGKSLLKLAQNDKNFDVVAVFSRRNLDIQEFVSMKNLPDFEGKIDVLLLATGSFADFCGLEKHLKGKFHTVDCFDNHSEIEKWKSDLGSPTKISIVSTGWDPGILSAIRAMFSTFENQKTVTFWGRGISQGHSNAIREIDGVEDGVQFTVPKRRILRQAKRGKIVSTDSTKNHTRLCFVCAKKQLQNDIRKKIQNLPNYFAPYKTIVRFVSEKKIAKLKQNMSHCGCVCTQNQLGAMSFDLKANSNADFTAAVMLSFAKAVPKLVADGFSGAIDCLDVPLKYFVENKSML